MWQATYLTLLLFYSAADALTCRSDSLKITIATLPDEYDFNEYEEYELKATIAYSLQKYCGGENPSFPEASSDCNNEPPFTAQNVSVHNITDRISMCVSVASISSGSIRTAIKASKANLNGALLLTDDTLYVDGIQPTLSPVPSFDFAPWIIAYIVIFALILLGGVAMLVYSKFYSKNDDDEDEKKSIIEKVIEDAAEQPYEEILEKTNAAFQNDSVEEEQEAPVTML